MSDEVRVHLVFDPYRISDAEGDRVRSVAEEVKAFREIGILLKSNPQFETVHPRTFVIETSWEHFRTFRGLGGVQMHMVSPRARLQERFGAEPPTWMTDRLIAECKLLEFSGTLPRVEGEEWGAAFGAVLFPGVAESNSLDEYLAHVARAKPSPSCFTCAAILDWLAARFVAVARLSIHSPDIVFEFRDELRGASSPVAVVEEWIRRRSLLPILRHDIDRPLSAPGLQSESLRDLVLAGYLPQLFPLPADLHARVSHIMRRAVHRARVDAPESFEAVVLRLNALWDGVPDELSAWLDIRPRAMTPQAALHLQRLPGFEASELVQRLVLNYSPPQPVLAWDALGDGFDSWVTSYAAFINRMFFRREMPASDVDPATSFGRWLKDNPTVFFNHPERGYRYVAKTIQEALGERRAVLVVLMDAMGIQLASMGIGYLGDAIGTQPTRTSFVLSPLPTVTEVCKEAILSGQFPSECRGNLNQSLLQSYRLEPEELRLAANWQDAERLQFTSRTRLVVYRDNRIDDQLKTSGTYKVLAEECPAVFSRVARLVERWVRDLTHLRDSPPLVILTADHGFTFGPPPGSRTQSRRTLDGSHRCIQVEGDPSDEELADESLTLIDREVFHLHNSYLAARGRYFGTGTASGWALSHGGLLPEEVVIPVVEWFGGEVSLPWPEVSFPGGASRDREKWVFTVLMRNSHSLPFFGMNIRINLAGDNVFASHSLARLDSNESRRITLEVATTHVPPGENVAVDVRIAFAATHKEPARERIREASVPKAKQLVIRTAEQAAFEDMF